MLTSFAIQDRFGDVAEDRRRDVVAELGRALDRGGDRDLRVVGRGEADEPGLVLFVAAAAGFVAGVSAVPVLPATGTPEIAALVPVPSLTTPSIAVVSSSAVLALTGWLYSEGSSRSTTRPSGSTTRFQICGFISLPPLATAAATIAICSGVASSRSWPIATRARSTGSFWSSSPSSP